MRYVKGEQTEEALIPLGDGSSQWRGVFSRYALLGRLHTFLTSRTFLLFIETKTKQGSLFLHINILETLERNETGLSDFELIALCARPHKNTVPYINLVK